MTGSEWSAKEPNAEMSVSEMNNSHSAVGRGGSLMSLLDHVMGDRIHFAPI